MSDHDHAEMNLRRSALAPSTSALLSSAVLARAAADAAAPGATCRLGDASCAAAHASGVSRSALGNGAMLHRSLRRLQRDYGNAFVGRVLRQATDGETSTGSMDSIERAIDSARGGGQAMDHRTRGQMESAFGADFSGVGLLGPSTLERRTEISAKPAPSAIMIRMESQPCIGGYAGL